MVRQHPSLPEGEDVKLNLGSGQRPFGPGWTNVDTQARWKPDICADATEYLRTLSEGAVEMIVLHHVIEHYGCGEADALLRECHRILCPGGSLLVFVPDLAELAHGWLQGRIDDQVYATNLYGAWMGDEADRHKWGYTRRTLRATLLHAGFRGTHVRGFDGREIAGTLIAQDWWILGEEAIK